MVEKEVLMEQTRDTLKENLPNLKLPNVSCKVMVDERVPPTAGEEFIGVYGQTLENLNPPNHITKRIVHGLTIGITRRVLGVPNEQTGENILTENQIARLKPSMFARANQIIESMLDSDGWTLIGRVNTLVAASSGGCFLSPLGLISVDPTPETVDESHFDQEAEGENPRYVGLLLELQFGGAEYFNRSLPPS